MGEAQAAESLGFAVQTQSLFIFRCNVIRTLSILTLCAAFAAPAAAQITIDQLAPENSVFVVGIQNVQRSIDRFKRTPLHALLESKEFKNMTQRLGDDGDDGLWDMLSGLGIDKNLIRELGIESDDPKYPTGSAGFAVFPVIDAERGVPSPAFVAYADYGAQADRLQEILGKALDRLERDRRLEYEEKAVLGRTVFSIEFRDAGDAPDFDLDDEFDPFGIMPGPGIDLSAMTLHLVRSNDAFLLSNDLGSLTETLDRIDGRFEGNVGTRPEFQATLSRLGPSDAYAVVLMRDLLQIVAGDNPMAAMMIGPMIESVFGRILALGVASQIDTPQAMVEWRGMVYMPEGKRGITRLFDVTAPPPGVPGFAPPNALSFTSFFFRFDRLAETVRAIIMSNPMLQMMAGDVLEIVDGPVHEVMMTLGTRVYTSSTLERPISLESMSNLFAVEVRRPDEFENLIGMWAPQIGLESRDFLGRRIYSFGMGGMGAPELAMGIGGGFVFLGDDRSVEQALRAVAQPEHAITLATEPRFARAMSTLPSDPGSTWGYIELVDLIEAVGKIGQMSGEAMREHLREQHPEFFDEDDDEDDAMAALNKVDFDLLRRYIGPLVSHAASVDDGFTFIAFLLSAEAVEAR
jgi:hypothetical protein